jgi:hypothetical protein
MLNLEAGLLTPGSNLLATPSHNARLHWLMVAFVTGHSGGSVADFHGIPFSPSVRRNLKGTSRIKQVHGYTLMRIRKIV